MTEDIGELIRRASTPSFETIGALMSADQAGTVSEEELDRNLWLLICRRVRLQHSGLV